MKYVDALVRLGDLREALGCETLAQVADYCLLHYTSFDSEFIRFCERYLEQQEQELKLLG